MPILPNCASGIRHTLTIGTSPTNTGVTLTPSGGSYCEGTVVTLTPYSNDTANYLFNSWSGTNAGDVGIVSGSYTIVIDADKSITPVFNARPASMPI